MDVRPTADRLRETLFNVLTGGNPAALAGSVWIDLYAGTGAVGIEALSRGAEHVAFVESSAAAARLIRENLASLELASGFEVLLLDASKALRKLATAGRSADFLFLDPPYRMRNEYGKVLSLVGSLPILKSWGVVIVEHEKRFDPGEGFAALRRFRKLEQGDAALSFYRAEIGSVAQAWADR
jgi:16S rRNA (guanine966-N2)-methyltransferase